MFVLKNIKLEQFRCYNHLEMSFSSNRNVIVGDNAVGKTTLVEAIYCLAFTKSYKTNTDEELIQEKQTHATIRGMFEVDEEESEVFISYSLQGKRILINRQKINRLSEYVGYCNVVLFCPEDLELVKGSPSGRRKFLDTNLSQTSKRYLKALTEYKRILKQRNEWLKQTTNGTKENPMMLQAITTQLIEAAKAIVEERRRFIDDLNPLILEKGEFISNNKEQIAICYEPSVQLEDMEQTFYEKMKTDILAKTTTVGPHRDDFTFTINNKNASSFASQGQQRTAALSLKLGLASWYETKTSNIIVVLDDVFSELDATRQNTLVHLLNQNQQIFITTTTIKELSEELLTSSNIIQITKKGEQDER